ncbi:MAG: hypothetical protein HFF17_01730 [Oscillospiraceae bacterium]|nr:hypothetical protein [Oscillospiraceae bacterium]
MKKPKNTLLLVFTLLLTLLGAALPYAASRAQDARIARDGSVRALEAVDLNLWEPTGACQVLALFAQPCCQLSSQSVAAAGLHLTAGEAEAAAWDAVRALRQAGLLESWTGHFPLEAAPYLLFSEDRESTAAVWLCSGGDSGCQLVLDDASGQLVSIHWGSPWIGGRVEPDGQVTICDAGYNVEYDAGMAEACAARLERWARFCEEYYARDVERVEGSFAEAGEELRSGGQECFLRFFLRDGSEACAVRLMLWETMTAFNG